MKTTTSNLRIVIFVDMEGISGIPNDERWVTPMEETNGKATMEYLLGCDAMMLDVYAAIEGLRHAGISDIVIVDSHWYDSNLREYDFDVPILRGSQAGLNAVQDADAAIMIGWHAKAGTKQAYLPHTYTDRIASLSIDEQDVGEIGMLRRLIASYGVPVVLITGDAAACDEARRDGYAFPFETVTSKSIDREGNPLLRKPMRVHQDIMDSAYRMAKYLMSTPSSSIPLIAFEPGQFKVRVQSGFEIAPYTGIDNLSKGSYIFDSRNGIRASYLAFQHFVEQLPSVPT